MSDSRDGICHEENAKATPLQESELSPKDGGYIKENSAVEVEFESQNADTCEKEVGENDDELEKDQFCKSETHSEIVEEFQDVSRASASNDKGANGLEENEDDIKSDSSNEDVFPEENGVGNEDSFNNEDDNEDLGAANSNSNDGPLVIEEEFLDSELLEDENLVNSTDSKNEEIINNSNSEISDKSEKSTVLTLEPLPECRNKRSYVCGFCNLKTINPREYLYHLRDTHGDNIKIFECSLCTYASKTQQKLVRHNHMVHKISVNPEISDQKKKPKEKIFKPSSKKLKTAVPMSRSPRESKSPRRFQEYEFMNDSEIEFDESYVSTKSVSGKPLYNCEQCKFSTFSTKVLAKHELKYHLKRKFFKCTRCNYATQVKARYTKHMKYHQLPIIKCDWCDFRTPYRWNLDRHTKNHTEEVGEHRCHLCNFSAQIKQSLTVHIANHHLTPEQIKERESKRIIGVCDPEDCMDEEEMELLRMERDEDLDALELPESSIISSNQTFTVSNIDMGIQDEFDSSINGNDDMNLDEPMKKKPKIKITLKKMKTTKDTFHQEQNERHNFEKGFIHPDDVQRQSSVYIKSEKCSLCSFKASSHSQIQKHMRKVHGIHSSKSDDCVKKIKKSSKGEKFNGSESSSDSSSENSKRKYFNDCNYYLDEKSENVDDLNEISSNAESINDPNIKPDESSSKDLPSKKRSSFFDKLQEKLSSSNVQNLVCQFCGHESKCLSESVRHQKLHLSAKNLYATPSLSTRCQFCRHRCKTTDDLINHLKSCPEARKNQISDMNTDANDDMLDDRTSPSIKESDTLSDEEKVNQDAENKHPMENKVFVWNTISNFNEDESNNGGNDMEENSLDGCSVATTASENSLSLRDMENVENPQKEERSKVVRKKVYRCPQCKFWSATGSRFHIHIIGHYNTKPHRCSECSYRSNWRWDVTKHIKLKMLKDHDHQQAEVRLVDETGEKNYEKYDKYLVDVKMDETISGRPEGATSSRGNRKPKFDNDSTETDSSKSSPCPTPLTISSVSTSTTTPSTGPSTSKIPAPPKLMRAPNRQFTSSPGPNPFGPINPGAQMMVEMGNANPSDGDASKKKFSMKPPPLVAMGTYAQQQQQQQQHQQQQLHLLQQQLQQQDQPQQSSSLSSVNTDENPLSLPQNLLNAARDEANASGSNYQIITPQGALHTSLETLQLLAAGSTNLAKLKRQQKETGEGNNPELDAAVANQMRLILWLNCLAREAEKKEADVGNPSEPPISSIMQLVLDHEGNPEWKCLTCDFRDNEQETVVQHVRLAHSKKGPVSLLHAVHRCSVCGFAAGTKRHVQVHLETAHNGQGGIISRSEGQNIDPESGIDESNRSFDCRLCPFTCKKRGELKAHLSHHTPRVDYVFKCMFCPYYVATKSDLFSHLSVHGMDIPASVKEMAQDGNSSAPIPTMVNSMPTEDGNARHFVCDLCPFETRSRAKLMHHRQFHRPRGLPFSCPHCSYNVTRRHLLAQHLRIHGVSPTEGLDAAESQSSKTNHSKMFSDDSFSRSKSPSPSLTITPISSGKDGENVPSKIDPACLPTLSDELTKNLHDIPLVWVSRDGRYFKMFKCRHCPHVNLRKTNIQEHEKMHRSDGLIPGTGHACQFCTYICINAGVMSAHLKVHSGSMGKCHAIVDQALPNEEQLHMMAGSVLKTGQAAVKQTKQGDEKVLYYCQHCPGRFFMEREVFIHSKFHASNSTFTHHCSKCTFGARDESQILAHDKVHTSEFQERTRTLMTMHPASSSFPPVSGVTVPVELDKPMFGVPNSENDAGGSSKGAQVNGFSRPWLSSPGPTGNSINGGSVPQPPPTSKFKCDQCPSSFSKLITLQYHQSLHSADNPFKCSRCSYAAKTQDGLQQHVVLHEQADLEKSSARSCISSTSISPIGSPSPLSPAKKSLEETLGTLTGKKLKKGLMSSIQDSMDHPPIKLKLLKGTSSSGSSKKQFKYYIEEQVPLSGVELLKRKNQIEREMPKDSLKILKSEIISKAPRVSKPEDRCGNPNLHYPLHIDKSSGRSREKRYKCARCPSAFEKLDQFNVHLNLHGSNYKYKCKICDYSVKFYANFMMHIKRHKYHEKVDAQKKGLPPPPEDQMKYEPAIGENSSIEESREREELLAVDKENQFDFDAFPDMTTAEKQQIILQHKKADAFKPKDEDKDRRIFYCQYCPYANMRRDAVDSHSMRHQANMGRGVYQCNFCDYTASQPNFIREHTKVHFRPFKYVQPEGFMRHDKLEVWSIKSEAVEDDDTPKKALVFGHEEGAFTPVFNCSRELINKNSESEVTEEQDIVDSQEENGILVDFRSGDVVEAPSNFIISLRPTKGKSNAVNTNGSSSGKHKSSKCMRARKKAKLENPVMSSRLEPEDSKTEMEEQKSDELNYNSESNALCNQEDNSVYNSPSASCSPSNPEQEDHTNENSSDAANVNSSDIYQEMDCSPSLKENYDVPVPALSH